MTKGKRDFSEGILASMVTVNLFYDILESFESMVIWVKVKNCFLRGKLDSLEMVCLTS